MAKRLESLEEIQEFQAWVAQKRAAEEAANKLAAEKTAAENANNAVLQNKKIGAENANATQDVKAWAEQLALQARAGVGSILAEGKKKNTLGGA